MADIKMIFTDIGRVLITYDDRCEVLKRIVRWCGGNEEAIATHFHWDPDPALWEKSIWHRFDTGELSMEALWQHVCTVGKVTAERLPFIRFVPLYVDHLRPIEGTIAIMRQLQNRYPIIAVSDGDFTATHAVASLETHHGLSFSLRFVSGENGVRKPALLELAVLTAENHNPDLQRNECIFIDDTRHLVEAAGFLGMKGVLFDATRESAADLVGVLKTLGMVFD